MAEEIRVPTLGESLVEATVGRWLKQEGDRVDQGETLVELETDKVNFPVEAPVSGVLERIAHREGDTVGINEVLALLNTANGASAAPAAPAREVEPVSRTADENGHQPLATPMALKIAAENNVDISKIKGSGANGKITIEDVKSAIEQSGRGAASSPVETIPTHALPTSAVEKADGGRVAAPASAPPVERVPTPTPPRSEPAPASPTTSPLGALTTALNRREEREPMSRLRQTIARRLTEVLHTAAMLTTFNEVDMSAVMEVRKRRRDAFKERHGVNLGFMSFFTKAAVGALKAFPYLNAEIQGEEIVKKYYYDIGIAVGTERGLVVPVVRDADRKTFAQIEKDIAELAQRAREGKLTIPEMLGGTFTITNGGVYGSLMSTPILNAPQVGILGMHKIQERPVVVDGQVVVRPMMYLALSYDHRIVDGSEAVRFLVRIKELIEDPESLLLEG